MSLKDNFWILKDEERHIAHTYSWTVKRLDTISTICNQTHVPSYNTFLKQLTCFILYWRLFEASARHGYDNMFDEALSKYKNYVFAGWLQEYVCYLFKISDKPIYYNGIYFIHSLKLYYLKSVYSLLCLHRS